MTNVTKHLSVLMIVQYYDFASKTIKTVKRVAIFEQEDCIMGRADDFMDVRVEPNKLCCYINLIVSPH